jgi:hypothetical protein
LISLKAEKHLEQQGRGEREEGEREVLREREVPGRER